MSTRHSLLGGKVQVYRRPLTPHWHCAASIGGRQYRKSSKSESLAEAKDFAEDWYLQLRGMHRFGGGIKVGRTFRDAAKKFLEEYETITLGERSPGYVASMEQKLNKHLLPFFGNKRLSEITPGLVQEYRAFRNTPRRKNRKQRPLRSMATGPRSPRKNGRAPRGRPCTTKQSPFGTS